MKAHSVVIRVILAVSTIYAYSSATAQVPIQTGQQRSSQPSQQQIANQIAAQQKACADAHANLPAPQSFVATPVPSTTQMGTVNLSWVAVPGAEAYHLYRSWRPPTYNSVVMATIGNDAQPFLQLPGSANQFVEDQLPLFYPVTFVLSAVRSATMVTGALRQLIVCESPRVTLAPVTPIAAPNAPVWGFADTHTHQFPDVAFGGYIIGRAFGDPQHAFDGDYVGHGILAGQMPHKTGGYPNFDGWPTWNILVHQQMYDDWLYRAFLGGLRLMVMHGVNNETLCMAFTGAQKTEEAMTVGGAVGEVFGIGAITGAAAGAAGAAFGSSASGAACNDMAAVDQEIQAAWSFESFLNLQCQQGADPPRCPQKGMGWYHIALSAEEARAAINRGQMAVVLGIEVDRLFDCDLTLQGDGRTGGRPYGSPLDTGYVDTKLNAYFGMGVRHIFPAHLADTAFAGMAIYDAPISWNYNSRFLNGQWINAGPCPKEIYPANPTVLPNSGIQYDFNLKVATEEGTNLFALLTGLGLQGNPPYYPPSPPLGSGGHCNQMGLTDLGKFLISDMMSRHMIIDIDHMSMNSVNDTFRLTTSTSPFYPVIAGHTGFLGIADPSSANASQNFNERSKTDNQLQYIKDSGGMVGVGIAVGTAATFTRGGQAFVANDCPSSSKAWAQEYLYAISKLSDSNLTPGIGLATDQPLSEFPGPRFNALIGPGVQGPTTANQGNAPQGTSVANTGCGGNSTNVASQMNPVRYPITVFSPAALKPNAPAVPVFLQQSHFANRTWDYNTDGMAHIGLYPDFVQDLLNVGMTPGNLVPLFHSAEQYLQMWQRAEQIHFVLPPPPPSLPQLAWQVCPTVSGTTCQTPASSVTTATASTQPPTLKALIVVSAAANKVPVAGVTVSVSNKVVGTTLLNGAAVVTYSGCTISLPQVTVTARTGAGPVQKPVNFAGPQGNKVAPVPCTGALTKSGFQTALITMPQ